MVGRARGGVGGRAALHAVLHSVRDVDVGPHPELRGFRQLHAWIVGK